MPISSSGRLPSTTSHCRSKRIGLQRVSDNTAEAEDSAVSAEIIFDSLHGLVRDLRFFGPGCRSRVRIHVPVEPVQPNVRYRVIRSVTLSIAKQKAESDCGQVVSLRSQTLDK